MTRRDTAHLEQLQTEARYHQERLALYRARGHGSRTVSVVRLRELERAAAHAATRLRRAKSAPQRPRSA